MPGDKDVEVALVPALVRERRAGGDFLHLGELGDPRQDIAVHAGKERGPFEHGDLVAHGWSFPRPRLAVTGPPRTHDLAKGRELADVIRVVVADDAHLAQERVARRVGQDRIEVSGGVAHDRLERLEV